ncbi:MAG: DUF962 domain-containing protein [Bacteroidota bacterium]
MKAEKRFQSLQEFYPFYLTEHSSLLNRALHFTGTSLLFVIIGWAIYTQQYVLMWFLPVAGYGFAWAGHFFVEKNKPATFQYPFYSLISDFIMYFDMWTFQVKKKLKKIEGQKGNDATMRP